MGNNLDNNMCCNNDSTEAPVYDNLLVRLNNEIDCKMQKVDSFNIKTDIYDQFTLSVKTSFIGCSQIQLGPLLIVCGCDLKEENTSAFLYSINTDAMPVKLKTEINSEFPHYYPSLGQFNNDNVIVIGGKGQKNCEIYSISLKKWRTIKELPEERYGADVYVHSPNYTIYLYGGINTETNTYYDNILKMSIPSFNNWKTISLKEDCSPLLKRAFTAHCVYDSRTLLILGGESEEGDLDDVLVWNLCRNESDFVLQKSKLKLPIKHKFITNKESKLNYTDKFIYCYEEKEVVIMKIDMISGEVFEQVLDKLY